MKLANERGGALIIVLLTITLISIFSVTLLFQLTSAKKQFNQTEGDIQATNTAEMGLIYIRQEILEVYKSLSSSNNREDVIQELSEELSFLPFEKSFKSATITPTKYEVDVNIERGEGNTIIIENTSTGTVGEYTKTLSDRISLSYVGSGDLSFEENAPSDEELKDYNKVTDKKESKFGQDTKLEGDHHFLQEFHITSSSNQVVVDGDLYLEEGAHVNNNGNTLHIKGNLFSESTNFKGGTKSKIIVERNAIFKQTGFSTSVPICIKGSTNYENPNEINDCSQALGKDVYVTGENGGGEWVISTNE